MATLPDAFKGKNKKNTKLWCKGKVGVKHDYELQVPHNDSFPFRMIPICLNCGKQDYINVYYWCRHHEEWENKPNWNHETEQCDIIIS